MENNICIINIKCIKFKFTYLNILILILIYSIPEICFCSNEKNITTNSNYVAKKLKDPTIPKTFKSNLKENYSDDNDEETLKLSIIMIKDSDKTVTINNRILREQEQIDGYQIIKIEANKVLLQDLNTNTSGKLYSSFKKFLSNNAQTTEKNAQTTEKNAQTTEKNAQTTANNAQTTVNNAPEKFIELSLPKIIIKESIEN